MADRKTILVTGATGAQGGSVARHLLATGRYDVRCLTRDPSSQKAQALAARGAKLVAGDLANADSLRPALRGCWGVFGVTNFWEHFAREMEHGRNLVAAVAQSAPECFIFSSLAPAKQISGGTLSVPHFDIKAELEADVRRRGLPAVFTHVAYYYENFLHFFPPRKQPDGSYLVTFPQGDTPLAAVCVEDVGGVVAAIFNDPAPHRGKVVGVVGEDIPMADYARTMSQATGKRVVYRHMPREQYAALGFPGAEELANMFEFYRLFVPNRRADLEQSRRLYPKMRSFADWANAHRDDLLKAMGE